MLPFLLAVLMVAQPTGPQAALPQDPSKVRLMHLLVPRIQHDIEHERWNAYGQVTLIYQHKRPFAAPYTNVDGSNHSLLPGSEPSFTGTATLFLGLRLWTGAQILWVPELISERPLSNLTGLGSSVQNFELQKTGSTIPKPYSSRLFLQQTFDIGGSTLPRASAPMQLGGAVKSRRLVLTLGNFSILDLFDRNNVLGDPRRQFYNISFLAHAAYDFAADARGYAWGGVIEWFHDDWAVRLGRITPPQHPNQLPLDFHLWRVYGDQLEIEHDHSLSGLAGAVRLLAFRNREVMGRFDEALEHTRAHPEDNAPTCEGFNYDSTNSSAPDLCWVRRAQIKWGVGLNLEQQLTRDVGFFARGMFADGQTEVYSYTATDRSLSAGLVAHGIPWQRPADVAGLAMSHAWISRSHADYLGAGGVDGFIGDGRLTRAAEHVIEFFYAFNVIGPVWLSADYQLIVHPAYNADRGPVNIVGLRLHGEG